MSVDLIKAREDIEHWLESARQVVADEVAKLPFRTHPTYADIEHLFAVGMRHVLHKMAGIEAAVAEEIAPRDVPSVDEPPVTADDGGDPPPAPADDTTTTE